MQPTDAPTTPVAAPTAPPLHQRPGFWTLILLTLTLLYGGWASWLQWQKYRLRQDAYAAALAREHDVQASLEARMDLLRDALKKDPCAARQALKNLGLAKE